MFRMNQMFYIAKPYENSQFLVHILKSNFKVQHMQKTMRQFSCHCGVNVVKVLGICIQLLSMRVNSLFFSGVYPVFVNKAVDENSEVTEFDEFAAILRKSAQVCFYRFLLPLCCFHFMWIFNLKPMSRNISLRTWHIQTWVECSMFRKVSLSECYEAFIWGFAAVFRYVRPLLKLTTFKSDSWQLTLLQVR